jgi:hypothetical protein
VSAGQWAETGAILGSTVNQVNVSGKLTAPGEQSAANSAMIVRERPE